MIQQAMSPFGCSLWLWSSICKGCCQSRLLGRSRPLICVFLSSCAENAEAVEVRKLDIYMQVACVLLPWQRSQTLMLEQLPAPENLNATKLCQTQTETKKVPTTLSSQPTSFLCEFKVKSSYYWTHQQLHMARTHQLVARLEPPLVLSRKLDLLYGGGTTENGCLGDPAAISCIEGFEEDLYAVDLACKQAVLQLSFRHSASVPQQRRQPVHHHRSHSLTLENLGQAWKAQLHQNSHRKSEESRGTNLLRSPSQVGEPCKCLCFSILCTFGNGR